MKKIIVTTSALIATTLLATNALAQQAGVADDGREIILKEDGTWEYKSKDKFVTLEDGSRVRLKEDGSWEYDGNAPEVKPEQIRTSSLDVRLGESSMEYYKEKLNKSTRYQAQTHFKLEIAVSQHAKAPVDLKLGHFNLIQVSDSRDETYPVVDISPQPKTLKPGETASLKMTVKGAPAGLLAMGVKYMEVDIDKSVFNTEDNLHFRKSMDDIPLNSVDKPLE